MFAIIPYHRFELKSIYSKNVTLGKINLLVEPRTFWRPRGMRGRKPFEGEFDGFDFRITRVMVRNPRRSSRFVYNMSPRLIGKIHGDDHSSLVKITTQLPIIFTILMWSLLFLPIFFMIFGEGSSIVYQTWFYYGLFYVFVVTFFNLELKKAKKILAQQLDAAGAS